MSEDELERKLYIVRKRAQNEIAGSDIPDKEYFYLPSLSCRTIVYKGLLLAPQIEKFYEELTDPDVGQRSVLGSPTIFDEYIPKLEPGASLSLHRPQRRNQHVARERQLDERPSVGA